MRSYKHILMWFALAVITVSGCSNRQPQQKHVTVAIVSAGANFTPFVNGFMEGMQSAGYEEGKNLTYLYDGPTPKEEVDKRLAFLKKQKIDLLYTMTTPITLKAKKIFAGSNTPILFAPIFSPVDAGLVDAKSRCGVNITGIMVRGSTEKTFGYLLECMPTLKTLFVPYHQNALPARLDLADLQKEAARHGVTILTAAVDNKDDLNNVIQNIPEKADCLWMTHSRLIVANGEAIIKAATQQKIPVVSATAQSKNGALLAYAPNAKSMGRQASRIADKILGGTDASHIRAETAEYSLGINLKTANALGIGIRTDILRQADCLVR